MENETKGGETQPEEDEEREQVRGVVVVVGGLKT